MESIYLHNIYTFGIYKYLHLHFTFENVLIFCHVHKVIVGFEF